MWVSVDSAYRKCLMRSRTTVCWVVGAEALALAPPRRTAVDCSFGKLLFIFLPQVRCCNVVPGSVSRWRCFSFPARLSAESCCCSVWASICLDCAFCGLDVLSSSSPSPGSALREPFSTPGRDPSCLISSVLGWVSDKDFHRQL